MRRNAGMILVVCMLAVCVLMHGGKQASAKEVGSRAIAIVFDNSGSMYKNGSQAWCRATYAMEVFASMLNEGDILQIYPMHPITVNGVEYTMENPFQITDASQASIIRDIYTEEAWGTPIESVDYAIKGLKNLQADNKYMIVLTDGSAFYLNNSSMSASETRRQLDSRFQNNIGKNMTIMYLGIGTNVVMPATENSEYFAKKQAKNSDEVLSALTDMCNQIFGRDIVPANHISGETVEFDLTMRKVIIFVQGEDVSDVELVGKTGTVGKQLSSASTKYATAGCGNYESVSDTSLQGMLVTYADCTVGSYELRYSGTATSIEVYYEPDADLEFIFTDAYGNTVDNTALYAGEYRVSFGMKDAKTGVLIASDLLGNPHYKGSYSINGCEIPITHEGYSGEVPITLGVGDSFDAELTVTYLGGYVITKDAVDFGWPEGGVKIASRPAGTLKLVITDGDDSYPLSELEEGKPYIAKVYYRDELLTGDELEQVKLKWDPEKSNVEIKKEFLGDHYELTLHYKESTEPKDTVCGKCTVDIYAYYTEKDSDTAETQTPLTYTVEDDSIRLQMELKASEKHIIIRELGEGKTIAVNLEADGRKLTKEELEAVELEVDCSGLQYTLIEDEENSGYVIQLMETEGVEEGRYAVKVKASYTDKIGRTTQQTEKETLTLSVIPLWLKWTITLLLLILLIIIIYSVLHIKVLPKYVKVGRRESTMIFDGEDQSVSTTFQSKMAKGKLEVTSKYAGTKTGLSMNVKPGKESYLCKPQKRRSAEVKSTSVRKVGSGTIQEATVGGIKYILNEETGKLERIPKSEKPFLVKNGTQISYSGILSNGGTEKPFTVTTKLNFKKK